jgi:phospholipid transport system substrate-binding protein
MAADSPKAFVQTILQGVMAIQNNPGLDDAARARQIHRIIGRSFDFDLMAKDALGPTYGQISGGQRREFTDTFSFLFQDSYTRLVLKFLKKENIAYPKESQEKDRARVDTVIQRTNESIPVTYLMRPASGGWLLFDVMVDGVSILENYRRQFAQVIQTQGFQTLLQKMQQQRRGLQ